MPQAVWAKGSERPLLVRVRQLRKSFFMGARTLEVLKGINLQIHAGEMVGMVGASGAGKSTFLHLLGGLDRPTAGEVWYGEEALSALDDLRLAEFRNRSIGFVFQFHHLLPEFTALENTMMPAWIQRRGRPQVIREASELLATLGLGDRLHHRPGELSGGEQQRVALARALMNRPELILADEPTGNLDAKNAEVIHDLLCTLNRERGQAFVIVTHNERLAARLDRVFHLYDGRVLDI